MASLGTTPPGARPHSVRPLITIEDPSGAITTHKRSGTPNRRSSTPQGRCATPQGIPVPPQARSSTPQGRHRGSLANTTQQTRMGRRATAANVTRGLSAGWAQSAPHRDRRSQSTYDHMAQSRDVMQRDSRRPSRRLQFTFATQQRQQPVASSLSEERKEECRRKMLMWAEIVTALVKLQRSSRQSLFEGTLYHTQLEHIDRTLGRLAAQESAAGVAMFNPNEFKANRQMRLSERARVILRKEPEQRTDDDIYYATIALRGISLIAEYPLRMQRKLARYGRFQTLSEWIASPVRPRSNLVLVQTFEPRRVIVRQHHRPNAFYFILYGTVVVAVAVDDVQDAQTVCFLKRGESFGELSIMNGSPRQSTVITQDDVELLAIDVQTYESVFMVGGAKNINDPDHTDFMASLSVLRGWPLEELENGGSEKNVVFAYFKRGAVMVRDSNYNDWIYIVKSGSVQVLKKLIKTQPDINMNNGRLLPHTSSADILLAFQSDKITLQRLMMNSGLEFKNPIIPKRQQQQDEDVNGHESVVESTVDELEHDLTLLTDRSFNLGTERLTERLKRCQSAIIRTQGRGNHMGHYSKTRSNTIVQLTNRSQNTNRHMPLQLQKNTGRNTHRRRSTPADDEGHQKRTFLDDLDSAFQERAHIRTEADINPMFVHVQTLTKGDVFGVLPLVFGEQPSMCLVSNGAECVLIRKQFYEQHCPESLIRDLRTQLSPYPSDASLQRDLQTAVNWSAYKDVTLNEACATVKATRHKPLLRAATFAGV